MSKNSRYYFDAGNTRLKLWACDERDDVLDEAVLAHHGNPARAIAEKLPEGFRDRPSAIMGASVLDDECQEGLVRACEGRWAVTPRFASSRREQCGVRNGYGDDFARLGIDRWLALLGYDRTLLKADEVACIVDCGTAITIDLLAVDGCHEGGYIIPGVGLMRASLMQHTARVRCQFDEEELGLEPGRNTADAVSHGAMMAVVGLVEKVAMDRGAKLVLTGGDAGKAGKLLKLDYCEEPLLLLKGLQRYFADAGIS